MTDRVLVEILVAAPIETVWKAVRDPLEMQTLRVPVWVSNCSPWMQGRSSVPSKSFPHQPWGAVQGRRAGSSGDPHPASRPRSYGGQLASIEELRFVRGLALVVKVVVNRLSAINHARKR